MVELIPPTPDWLDRDLMADFVSSRREAKKPMTHTAIKRMVNKLGRLRDDGHCPSKLLEWSIINGWQDVWPDDSTKAANASESWLDKYRDKSWGEGL